MGNFFILSKYRKKSKIQTKVGLIWKNDKKNPKVGFSEVYNVPHVVDTHMQIIYPKFWLSPILETQIFILIPKLCNHMWLNQF